MPHNTPRSLPSPPSPAAYASTIFSRTPTLYYATYAFAYSASPHILPRTPPHIFCHVRPPYILPRTPPLSRISCRPPKTRKRPCNAMQGRFSICLSKACTRSRGRTGTGVNLLVFETSASTDSAIRADFVKIDCKCNHIFPFGKKSGQKITDKPHIILNMRIYTYRAYHSRHSTKATTQTTVQASASAVACHHSPHTKTPPQTTVSTSSSAIVRQHSLYTKRICRQPFRHPLPQLSAITASTQKP